MPEMVFWDTSAFVALGNRDDSFHQLATQVGQRLARQRAEILTTDAVLTEAINTFSKVAWREMAVCIMASLEHDRTIGAAEVVHVDESLWKRGWQLFRERSDKAWSLTDCISFVVMQDRNLAQAFTTDHHFEQAGFRILMGR
jgi:predicted nucleic acid-binding protein